VRGFRTGGITAEIVDHGNRLDFPDAFRQRWVCLGYRFECAQGVIAFSGDTVDCPGLRRLAANADILVHCCYPRAQRNRFATDAPSRRLHPGLRRPRWDASRPRANVATVVLTHHRQKPDAVLEEMRRMSQTISRGLPFSATTACASRCKACSSACCDAQFKVVSNGWIAA